MVQGELTDCCDREVFERQGIFDNRMHPKLTISCFRQEEQYHEPMDAKYPKLFRDQLAGTRLKRESTHEEPE